MNYPAERELDIICTFRLEFKSLSCCQQIIPGHCWRKSEVEYGTISHVSYTQCGFGRFGQWSESPDGHCGRSIILIETILPNSTVWRVHQSRKKEASSRLALDQRSDGMLGLACRCQRDRCQSEKDSLVPKMWEWVGSARSLVGARGATWSLVS